MSDNVSRFDLEEAPERKGLWRKIVAFVAVAAFVCGIVALILFSDGMNLDRLRRWVKYLNVADDGTYGSYAFDSHGSNRYAAFGEGLAIASVSGLNTYDANGSEVFVLQQQMSLPEIQASKDFVVAYDVGGNHLLAVHRRSGEVLRLEEKRPILDADLSDGGFICTSSSDSGYKSVLSVYNQEQMLVYRWLSSTTYIPLCAVSDDGKAMAAVGLGQAEGKFESSLYLFQTKLEDIQHTVSLGNQLIYELFFVREDVLCAIGENQVQFVNLNGEHLGSYAYGDRYLKNFTGEGDGFLTLALNMYRAGNRYSLITVDSQGGEIAETYIGQEILDLSANGRYIAVLTPERLVIYTQNLQVYAETAETGNATSVVMQEDGSVILLGNGQGHLYIP